MKNLFFEIKYYLIFLLIFIFLFLAIVFLPKIPNASDNSEFLQKEVLREKVSFSDDRLSLEVTSNNVVQIFEIKKNDTLLNLLKESNIKDSFIRALIKTKGSEKLAQIKVGDTLEIKKTSSGDPEEIFLTTNELDGILAKYNNGFFKIQKFSRPLEKLERFASVTIDDSLYESAVREGLSDSLIMDLVYLFGWDIDFIFDIRPGDKFDVLYEDFYWKGKQVQNPDIKAARFLRGNKVYTAIRYFYKNGAKEYFSLRGENVKKAFLRTPVEFSYISSKYNLNRKHPVLNKIRAHTGVDYAAPKGTPIISTSSGSVSFIGNKGGYGKLIEIKHSEDYSTRYAHLFKYKKGLKLGDKVSQGEVIGYVGKSGLATGYHLHYEFRVNGMHTDPLTVKLPDAEPIGDSEKEGFQNLAIRMINRIDNLYLQIYAAN
tara:strand:- start:3416 stop:4702 length:1287 start_codon:yes stop_codon:yes gene_type:complete